MSVFKRDIILELHKPVRKTFPRRHVIVKGLDDLWQADLAEFTQYARHNRGHKYILVVIDCFSKYLWTKPLKTKTAIEVSGAMRAILQQQQRKPKNIQTDAGKEFYNRQFDDLMKSYGIHHYSTYSTMKAAIVERVIRTVKEKLYREFSMLGKYRWIDILPNVTQKYNDSKHRTIGMKPNQVTFKNEATLLSTVYNRVKRVGKRLFSVGDVVRISKHKGVFEKGHTPNWSHELFKIVKVQITNPVTYLLEDMSGDPILGCFYQYELQKAKHNDVYLVEKELRKKGNRVYVKWLGLDKTHNSWINKSELV